MCINFQNKEKIELFVKDNINLINDKISEFSHKKYPELVFDKTDICRFLGQKFNEYIIEPDNRNNLLAKFESENYIQAKIKSIAKENGFYHVDLKKFYKQTVFEDLSSLNKETLYKEIVEIILDRANYTGNKKRFGKSQIESVISKSLYVALNDGFTFNLHNAEDGIMATNSGDSAQFLFLARAILAGYNCSNVDVRSSRYDAVIDQNGHLYRVQIKGISDKIVNFKDRDRAGRGIDPQNERNLGKRVSSADCDLFVAVDKQVGLCYIMPIDAVEALDTDSINIKNLAEYKENWHIIDNLEYK